MDEIIEIIMNVGLIVGIVGIIILLIIIVILYLIYWNPGIISTNIKSGTQGPPGQSTDPPSSSTSLSSDNTAQDTTSLLPADHQQEHQGAAANNNTESKHDESTASSGDGPRCTQQAWGDGEKKFYASRNTSSQPNSDNRVTTKNINKSDEGNVYNGYRSTQQAGGHDFSRKESNRNETTDERKYNVIVCGFHKVGGRDDDCKKFKQFCKNRGIKCAPLNAYRLGRSSDPTRKLKVVFSTPEEARDLIKKFNEYNDELRKKGKRVYVYVNPDLSREEQRKEFMARDAKRKHLGKNSETSDHWYRDEGFEEQ